MSCLLSVACQYPDRQIPCAAASDRLASRPQGLCFSEAKECTSPQHLPLEEETIAEVLRQHGYRTAHIGEVAFGRRTVWSPGPRFRRAIPRWNKGWPKAGYHAPFGSDGLTDSAGDYLTDRLTDEAIHFIDENQEPAVLSLSLALRRSRSDSRTSGSGEEVRSQAATTHLAERRPHFCSRGIRTPATVRRDPALNALVGDERYTGLPRAARPNGQDQTAPGQRPVCRDGGKRRPELWPDTCAAQGVRIGRANDRHFCSDNGGMSAANFGNPQRPGYLADKTRRGLFDVESTAARRKGLACTKAVFACH